MKVLYEFHWRVANAEVSTWCGTGGCHSRSWSSMLGGNAAIERQTQLEKDNDLSVTRISTLVTHLTRFAAAGWRIDGQCSYGRTKKETSCGLPRLFPLRA